MPICTCDICQDTSTYEDELGVKHPGKEVTSGEYKRHKLAQTKRRARTAGAEERVASDILLTTLADHPSSTMPVRHRDASEASSPSSGVGFIVQASHINHSMQLALNAIAGFLISCRDRRGDAGPFARGEVPT